MQGDRERQLAYEEEADTAAAAARLKKLVEEAKTGSTELPRATALISRVFEDVKREIEVFQGTVSRGPGAKFKNWLRSLPSDVASLISLRECIKLCTSSTHETHVHVQDLCAAVGRSMELEVRIRQANEVNRMYMEKIHAQVKENATRDPRHIRKLYGVAIDRVFKGEIEFDLTRADIIQIGKFGVDACYNVGMLEIKRGANRQGSTVEYTLAPEVYEFLTGYDHNDVRNVISTEESRMHCAPDPWTKLHDGGYLSARRKANAPLLSVRNTRKSERGRIASEFTAERMPLVFGTANYLQETCLSIHEATRAAIVRVWESGGGVLGVPRKSPPTRPEMPFGPDWVKEGAPEAELNAFARWKRKVVAYHREMRSWRSKVVEVGSFLRVSGETNTPLWFPVYVDRRGRWYYRGVPNPQGSDLAKSVLHFHEKRPLGADGAFWLRVHIANSFGFDKERFEDRARWTEQNWAMIERALDEPENHPEVWGTDAPWVMFSAAWELREALRSGNPATYCTGVPVHMDATCSGLQHFSAMLRDPTGGQYVNLTDPTGCGPKQDIYGRVAQVALQSIQHDLDNDDPQVRMHAEWWMAHGISRKLAKKPVMTYVYGATLKGTAEYIEDTLEEEGVSVPDVPQAHLFFYYAAKKLFQGIAATVPAAASAMEWLRSIAGQVGSKPMEWRTPTGFIVQHDYREQVDRRIHLYSAGVTKATVWEYTDGTRATSMRNAVAPNFVHALDASHLTYTALRMQAGGRQMIAIHDSFGTHPGDVAAMHRDIREAFLELYDGRNVLGEFLWEVGAVGEPPMRGTLDLKQVLDSEFFFC